MARIEWSEQYSVGIASIDGQHKKLLEMINLMNDAIFQNKGNQMVFGVLAMIASYTQSHFTYEEKLLKEAGYSDFEDHCKTHRAFIERVAELRARPPTSELALDVQKLLRKWLIHHIQETDKGYTSELHAHGLH